MKNCKKIDRFYSVNVAIVIVCLSTENVISYYKIKIDRQRYNRVQSVSPSYLLLWIVVSDTLLLWLFHNKTIYLNCNHSVNFDKVVFWISLINWLSAFFIGKDASCFFNEFPHHHVSKNKIKIQNRNSEKLANFNIFYAENITQTKINKTCVLIKYLVLPIIVFY